MATRHHPGSTRPASPLVRLTVPPPSALRLAAATLLVAAAGVVLPATPAVAATCSSETGVSVVVDATGVGGAIATSCLPDGGGDTAAALFEVHHDLTRASQFPGAVCRVDGAPADAPEEDFVEEERAGFSAGSARRVEKGEQCIECLASRGSGWRRSLPRKR